MPEPEGKIYKFRIILLLACEKLSCNKVTFLTLGGEKMRKIFVMLVVLLFLGSSITISDEKGKEINEG